MTGNTIFDKLLRKELPADIVHEDEWVFAVRDINPQAPVHVVVVPKKRCERFQELPALTPEDVGQFFQGVARVANKLKLDDKGYRIVVNNGRDGQQSVEYIHAHILGGRAMTWPPG